LWSHFEDAGMSPEACPDVLDRFGAESLVTESLRRVYRFDYAVMYLAKIAASLVASVAAALTIEALANLRVEEQADILRLSPAFSRGAGVSVAVVLGLVTAWEVCRPPFNRSRAALAIGAYATLYLLVQLFFASGAGAFVTATILVVLGYACSKLEQTPMRLLLVFGTFAAVLYANHRMLRVAFGPSRALLASAVLVAVWSSTVLILARVDHVFLRFFQPPSREAA
jgi:PAS domain-containing protein